MARFTKQVIMDAFTAAIADRPLDKITVTDLVRTCGINRNTFYYYFHDIYALASAVLEQGLTRLLSSIEQPARFDELFRLLTDYAEKNRRLVYHVYRSDHVLVEKHLFRAVSRCLHARFRLDAEGIDCTEKTLEQLSGFYACALVGGVLHWLNHGMREAKPEELAEWNRLLANSPRAILLQGACRTQEEKAV